MKELQKKIEATLAAYRGRWGMVILNHSSGQHFALNPDMAFPAASMIKIPIMYEVMRQAAAGRIDLEQLLIVKDELRVDGAGILKELRPGISMTIRELVTLMIILSDNTATNMLIDLLSMSSVNQTMERLGLKSTVLRRQMMDFAAAAAGQENETSPADIIRLLTTIYDHTHLPADYGKLMIDILSRQQVRDKLPFFLPEEIVIAHKTGTLPGVEHDGGILFLPGGPYIICIMTADLPANVEGLQLVATLGKVLYDHFGHNQTK
jgi:beta-lactamase class A